MKLAKQFNPEVETLEAVMEPPPPMGVVPSAPAFDAIAPDVMLINGTHFAEQESSRWHQHKPVHCVR